MTSVGAIERELAALRNEEASEHGGVRTNILDLVVYASTPELADAAAGAVTEMQRNRPSRALVALTSNDAGQVTTESTVFCTKPPDNSGALVCSDIVRLTGPSDGAALTSLVTSLLLPDLPVFLIWLGPATFDQPLYRSLSSIATRLVTDAPAFAGTLDALPALSRSAGLVLTDFAWTEITGWRELVAQVFDFPDHVALLRSLERVHVRHAPGSQAQARLLAGWVESRAGQEAEAGFEEVGPATSRPGALQSVEITCAGQTFRVERTDREWAVTSTPGFPDQRRALPEPTLADLLADELELLAPDAVFLDALHAATDLWR